MQTKDQWNRGKNWKVITAVGVMGALGVSGLALAGPGSSSEPEAITLDDARPVTSVTTVTSSVPTTVQDAIDRVADSVASRNSASSPLSAQSAESVQSVQSVQSAQSVQSTQSVQSAQSVQSTQSVQSAQSAPEAESAPSAQSTESAQSAPSAQSVDSPVSADSGSADS